MPYVFLFDTGGGQSFISPVVAEALKRPIYGEISSFRMNGEVVKYQLVDSIFLLLGSTRLFHPTVGVYNIMEVLPKELPPIYGVISLQSFDGKILTLDLSHDQIIVETATSFQKRVRPMRELSSRFATGLHGNELDVLLGLPCCAHLYWFLFDTGNIRNPLLGQQTAVEWGILKEKSFESTSVSRRESLLGETSAALFLTVESILYQGVLNYALLRQKLWLIHFGLRKVWSD